MIEQASLIIGDGNWAVKSDSLLGYATPQGKYVPRDMSVVRATTGTRVNADGLVELVPYNLLTYSQDFNNITWQKFNSTILSSNNLAPDGTLTAARLSMPLGSTSQFYNGFATIAATYTTSIWVRLVSGSGNFKLGFYDNVSFLTDPITVTSTWQRFSVTKTVGAAVGTRGCWLYSDDINQVIEVWGGQVVEGTQTKDYLPTTTRLNIPRIDYSTGSAALLVEPQRTNLALQSSSFDTASWLKDGTVIANTTISPSGVQDADTWTTVGATNAMFQTVSVTQNTNYVFSFYVKRGTINNLRYSIYNSTSGSFIISGVSYYSQTSATDWVRISAAFTTPSGCTAIRIYPHRGESGQSLGTVFFWGAQLEAETYASSYIPTTTASVTRNADVVSKTGISSLIGQTEGTMFLDVDFNNLSQLAGVDTLMTLNNGTTDNEISILLDTPSGENKTFLGYIRNAASNQAIIYAASPITATRYKVALSYKLNDVVLYINGTQIGTDTSATIPSTSALSLNSRSDNSFLNIQQEYVQASALWKTRLTNTQLAQLTTI